MPEGPDTKDDGHTTAENHKDEEPTPSPSSSSSSTSDVPDRRELLHQARVFLSSPSIRTQSDDKKRHFLLGKGVASIDVEQLLAEDAPSPPVPPRTYLPPPQPSNLPTLLYNLSRLLMWLGAGTGITFALYQRFIMPRIFDSYAARHSLQLHQAELLEKLNELLAPLKPASVESVSEEAQKVDGTGELPDEHQDVHELTSHPTLTLPDSIERLTSTLTPNPEATHTQATSIAFSRTLQSLTDLNAYISSETYLVPATSSFRIGNASSTNSRALGPAEEEVRREIRALKGLVLNRRSFVPSLVAARTR